VLKFNVKDVLTGPRVKDGESISRVQHEHNVERYRQTDGQTDDVHSRNSGV